MKLGKTKDVESFVDQLKSEGERKLIVVQKVNGQCFSDLLTLNNIA